MKPMLKNKSSLLIANAVLGLVILVPGCASDSQTKQDAPAPAASVTGPAMPAPAPKKVPLHKDKDIQGIWLAPGFNFKGYDAVYIGDTIFDATVRKNEENARTVAMGVVQSQLVTQLQNTGLFPRVEAGTPPSTGKNLKLVNTIIKYEKGGGGARYFAGLYGAGQPHIRVRGEMYDGENLVFVFEAERSGEGAGARMFGGYKDDEDIQSHDIYDLALDLATCIKRNAAK